MVKIPSYKYPQRVPVTTAWGALSQWLRVIVGSVFNKQPKYSGSAALDNNGKLRQMAYEGEGQIVHNGSQ